MTMGVPPKKNGMKIHWLFVNFKKTKLMSKYMYFLSRYFPLWVVARGSLGVSWALATVFEVAVELTMSSSLE